MTTKPPTNVSLTPVWVIFAITIAGSSSTGLFWNALGFIAKHAYGFSRIENLTLYLAMGLVYAASAWKAGTVGRIVGWSDRGGVLGCVLGMAVGLAIPAVWPTKLAFGSRGSGSRESRRCGPSSMLIWRAVVPRIRWPKSKGSSI